MDNNDFDIDFDFEKEYGMDPALFMDGDGETPEDDILAETGEDGDFSGGENEEIAEDDFNLDDILNDYGADEGGQESAGEDADFQDFDLDLLTRGQNQQTSLAEDEENSPEDYSENEQDVPEENDGDDEEGGDESDEAPIPRRPRKPRNAAPKKPSIFSKFLDMYLEPVRRAEDQEFVDANGRVRRRRKPTKEQIFKEVYLPAIIAGFALVLVLTFIVGSIVTAVQRKQINDEVKHRESVQASESAAAAENEFNLLIQEAKDMAAGYDYDGAIGKLDSFTGTDTAHMQEIDTLKAEYATAKNALVEYKDVSLIPNISFFPLINDMERALANQELKGQYNRNFVTTTEFSKILDQLYAGGYILVDFDDIVASSIGVDGKESYFANPLYLPEGKKPIMITETLVNYLSYMIDSNDDGVADAGGDGFASRLVVDASGNIRAEYVNSTGETLIGNYDLVPILEDFIAAHPDFSYRGARATLAVTGDEGVFGYRCHTRYISNVSQSYYDEQLEGAKQIVAALREKGYTIASYTFSNMNYRDATAVQIKKEMDDWTAYVTPVLDVVPIMVFAKEQGIRDYSGGAFTSMYDAGFRIFVDADETPSTVISSTYVRQNRLMVTGRNMGWHSSMFSGLFDCNIVLESSIRGKIPQ